MSKNTANIAQAISLLSDVLSREVADDSVDATNIIAEEELYDDLKEQALEFGQEVADELDTISADLDRVLESDDDDDDESDDDDSTWGSLEDLEPYEDDEDENDAIDNATDPGNGDVDITNTESAAADDTDDDESEPTDAEKVQMLTVDGAILQEKADDLEKSNEELSDKVEELTDTLRGIATLIESLESTADAFVSEVESL